jgi:hypothetical protein
MGKKLYKGGNIYIYIAKKKTDIGIKKANRLDRNQNPLTL